MIKNGFGRNRCVEAITEGECPAFIYWTLGVPGVEAGKECPFANCLIF